MVAKTVDLDMVFDPDDLASKLTENYDEWNKARRKAIEVSKEVGNYVFATDTSTTANASLPWKNKTTTPKLCQIRDNLHANYMAALFPSADWLKWEGNSQDSVISGKRKVIEAYFYNKLLQSDFQTETSKLVYDFIDYGNAFAKAVWVDERKVDELTGELDNGYVGPKMVRVSPYDIVFNPLSPSFEESPKYIRELVSIGELKKMSESLDDDDAKAILEKAYDKVLSTRKKISQYSESDLDKSERYIFDGFSSLHHYLNSGYVEVITFYGDVFDANTGTYYDNREIKILDRSHLISNKPLNSWSGKGFIKHAGWRLRPDNLYAMGPLDNLVGMQYRIDHLENLKADMFDMVAFPMVKIRGNVLDFNFGPNERIICEDDGDVTFMNPDTTALQADMQISIYENKMEEMSGAPRQAMGIRTPGEKTAFEVQTLDNAISRIFQNKVAYFEKKVLEPILNDMLQLAIRNVQDGELLRIFDKDNDVVTFKKITRDDLAYKGVIRAAGASHFARKANTVQNLTNMFNTGLLQDPLVRAHFSSKKLAQMLEDLLDLEQFGLYSSNIRATEEAEYINAQQTSQEIIQEQTEAGMPPSEEEILESAMLSEGEEAVTNEPL